jgi:putative redox protein
VSGVCAVAQDGLVTIRCAGSVDQVIGRIEALVEARGLTVFARVYHAAGARAAGLELAPTVLLLIGDARAGTPMMAVQRTVGIDLPLKLLAWADDDGAAQLTYNDPAWVAARHGLDTDGLPQIQVMAGLLEHLAAAAAQPVDPPAAPPIVAHDFGAGSLRGQIAAQGQTFLVDEPVDVGGTGLGPSPHGLLAAGLAACTTLTLRLYADRKAWPLTHIRVAASHDKEPGQTPPDIFHRVIHLEGPLDETQRARLMEIADKCPVHLTLTRSARISTVVDDGAATATPR